MVAPAFRAGGEEAGNRGKGGGMDGGRTREGGGPGDGASTGKVSGRAIFLRTSRRARGGRPESGCPMIVHVRDGRAFLAPP
jgi:hypothetical protein